MDIEGFKEELTEAGFPAHIQNFIASSFYAGLEEVILERVKREYCYCTLRRRAVG